MNETQTIKKGGIPTRNLVTTAMLSAVAFVLMYLEVAVPVMPSFIKFDFSDLPALLGAFALGPVYGIIIELIKNLLHLVVSQSMFIGELSNFILGASFVFTAGLIYKIKKTRMRALSGGLVGAVVMGLISIFSNMFLVYPIYVAAYFGGVEQVCIDMYDAISYGLFKVHMTSLLQCLVCFNLPFTIVKGFISVGISMLVYKPLSRFIKGGVKANNEKEVVEATE